MSSVHIGTTGDTELALRNAVLLYRSRDSGAVYATLHDVDCEGRSAPQILAGRPMTLPELATFASAAAGRTAYHGFISERVLYVGPNTVAWWVPASRRRVWFRSDAPLGTASGDTDHPGLVFVAHADHWYVFAVRGTDRPTATTPLYRAPYFNVWATGGICTGNVDLPGQPGPAAIAAYESAFFRSHFTHSNYHGTPAVKRRGGITQLWRDLLDGVDFPPNCLIARKETLAAAITRITKGE